MLPRNLEDEVTGENDAARRIKQKRLRNRLSQKAVRERKAARIQQLEQQLATVTKNDDSTGVAQLLKTNTRLRQTLLDTRKRLESLSATATQLSQRIKDDLDHHEQGEDLSVGEDSMTDQTCEFWAIHPQESSSSPCSNSTETICRNLEQEQDDFVDPDLELINACTNFDSGLNLMNHVPHSVQRASKVSHAISDHEKYDKVLSNLFLGFSQNPKLHVFSGSMFSEHLDHIHGLLRLGGALGNGSRMPEVVESMLAAFLYHGWPSMRYWFDATQSRPLGARVIWWQTSSSHEAANQIPPQNSPTLIQLSQTKYPCILDWVPHPGLRDQLILNYRSYDVDQVMVDMTNAFVVEVEEARSSIHSMQSEISTPIGDRGCSYSLMELVQKTLILGPVDLQSSQRITVMGLLQSSTPSAHSPVQHPIHRFKLDPRFFEKYPALYDPNAASKFRPKDPPLVQMSQLPLPLTTDSVKAYMECISQARRTTVMA